MENTKYNRYKWSGLIAFACLYNVVYLGRFNVNNLMEELSSVLDFMTIQREAISLSVFVSYAVGSFVNGYLADRFGAKKVILIGVVASAVLNMGVSFQSNWSAILGLWLANGYFQSMIWVGGLSLAAHWWQESERGKAVGIMNFSSGLSHVSNYLIPVTLSTIWPAMNWRADLLIPACLMLLLALVFGAVAVETPERVGEKPYEIDNYRHKTREDYFRKMAEEHKMPWRYFLKQKKLWWWCAIASLSSICRYGLLNWIPLYFDEKTGGPVLSDFFSNLMLPLGMAFGTLIITWGAGTKLFHNKGIIVTALAALCGMLVVIFPMLENSTSILIGIFFTGFTLYGINGILWLYALEQGGRIFAGSTAGILNAFAYFGAFVERLFFWAALQNLASSMAVFFIMELLCVCMVICGMVVSKKNVVVVPEVRE